MPRKPSTKPWPHTPSGYWCATVNGERKYLDKDYRAACRRLKALRAEAKREAAGGRDWLIAPFAKLADEFLSDRKHKWLPDTYDVNRARLLSALRIVGTQLRVIDFRKFHLAKVERDLRKADYSSSTIRGTLTATIEAMRKLARPPIEKTTIGIVDAARQKEIGPRVDSRNPQGGALDAPLGELST